MSELFNPLPAGLARIRAGRSRACSLEQLAIEALACGLAFDDEVDRDPSPPENAQLQRALEAFAATDG